MERAILTPRLPHNSEQGIVKRRAARWILCPEVRYPKRRVRYMGD